MELLKVGNSFKDNPLLRFLTRDLDIPVLSQLVTETGAPFCTWGLRGRRDQ